jgi:hypothetical protein
MVLRASFRGSPITISLKSHSLAVGLDDGTVVAWDRGGRLYTLVRGDTTWRRGLSGLIIEKRQGAHARSRRHLPLDEAGTVVDEAATIARRIRAAMETPDWHWLDGLEASTAHETRALLQCAAGFDAGAARADVARFAGVYRPVGILPPDQYLALVLQATEGCSFNTCTFCDLYHDRYRVKPPHEFRQHVIDVLAYLGESASLRSRGIFLGAANALAVPMATLLPVFEILADEADGVRRGVSAFVDGFTGRIRDTADYRALAGLGLHRVYVGLESGHDPLLAFVRKPGTASNAIAAVHAIKAAGVSVGIIVMSGLGGDRFADAHVADTAAVLTAMRLDEHDLLYFSELVDIPDRPYGRLAADADVSPLAHDTCGQQAEAIRAAVRFLGKPPAVATYDIREFVY